jgi:hypothetical protein
MDKLIKKYDLYIPTVDDLKKFFSEVSDRYYLLNLSRVDELLEKLTTEELIYLYYYHNLVHSITKNHKIDKAFRDAIYSYDSDERPIDMKILDSDIPDTAQIVMGDDLIDEKGKYRPIWFWKDRGDTDKVDKFCRICRMIQNTTEYMQDFSNTFLYTPTNPTSIHNRPKMVRNTTVVSDTDSVIYTVDSWVQYFNDGRFAIEPEDYQVSLFMTYWLTKGIKHVLELFSLNHGATEKHKHKMIMKNEYLYPIFMYFNRKKTYAALTAVQEGVRFAELEVDIKGGLLRSSNVSKEGAKFNKHLMVDGILKPAMTSQLSASDLIQQVVIQEYVVEESIRNREVTFYKRESINHKTHYDNPMSSIWFNWLFYHEVFEHKYGEIPLSTRAPLIPVATKKLSQEFRDKLATEYPEVFKRWLWFEDEHKKLPNYILINPDSPTVPEEIMDIIIVEDVITHTLRPSYRAIEQLGIVTGFTKKKLLLRQLYPMT